MFLRPGPWDKMPCHVLDPIHVIGISATLTFTCKEHQ